MSGLTGLEFTETEVTDGLLFFRFATDIGSATDEEPPYGFLIYYETSKILRKQLARSLQPPINELCLLIISYD